MARKQRAASRSRSTRGVRRRGGRRSPSGRKKTVDRSQGYTIRDSKGRIKYVGETNNPQRRAVEHKRAGKGGTLQVETRPMPRGWARRWEKQKLARHRKTHGGQNPAHNQTPSGGWNREW